MTMVLMLAASASAAKINYNSCTSCGKVNESVLHLEEVLGSSSFRRPKRDVKSMEGLKLTMNFQIRLKGDRGGKDGLEERETRVCIEC